MTKSEPTIDEILERGQAYSGFEFHLYRKELLLLHEAIRHEHETTIKPSAELFELANAATFLCRRRGQFGSLAGGVMRFIAPLLANCALSNTESILAGAILYLALKEPGAASDVLSDYYLEAMGREAAAMEWARLNADSDALLTRPSDDEDEDFSDIDAESPLAMTPDEWDLWRTRVREVADYHDDPALLGPGSTPPGGWVDYLDDHVLPPTFLSGLKERP